MRALKFAASALLMAAAAFGQQTTPYINPWANAGAPGQGALSGVGTASVSAPYFGSGGNVLSGNQVTFTTQSPGSASSYPPSTGPFNPGTVAPGNDPYGGQYGGQNPNPPYGNQYDPKNNYGNQYDPKNQYGSNPYGGQYGGQYGNQYDPKKGDRVNNGVDPNQAAAFFSSSDFRDQNRGTKVFAFQCKTAVKYVPVHCGDMVSITLDPEDACLAEQFDPMNHTMMINHKFMMSDFQGDVQKDMRQKGFTDQGFVGRTSWNAIAVRGTAVELEVLAEDECYNVGKGVDEPARDCETVVSGKCCAPVSNGLSQYAINQVLQSQGADQPHFMGTPTLQLQDINLKLP